MATDTAYQNVRTTMSMIYRSINTALVLIALHVVGRVPARADLYSLRSSGTISSSSDATIPVGMPFSFEFTYNTAAPDLDFEALGSPDPTYGVFNNTASPPALVSFHYQAGSYEVTLADPADFGTFSGASVTFTTVNAIDININAPALFPHLGGGAVSFHADFNAFSTAPIFTSDALPTSAAIGAASFDQSSVTLLPTTGFVTSSSLTSFSISAVQQPTIAGDFNSDGTVNAADYVVWRNNAGTTNVLPNDNGVGGAIREVQYDLWHRHFGEHVAVARANVSAAVPEPATALLFTMLAAGVYTRQRRNWI